MIELKNVTKTFHKRNTSVTALSDVSIVVPEGSIMGVIGASGAGKSTLIRCVNLLEKPTSGQVIVNGQNLVELSPSRLAQARRNIGMIFQHFNLLSSRTVHDNVALPLELSGTAKPEINERVTQLLDLVGLSAKANDYPASLSGGQKQRVAIARTLASNPKVLLCDEATSALDPATTRSILSLIKDINRRFNITVLLITHEMNVVKEICNEVAVISEGKLIEQGPVSEIFSHPKTELAKQFISSSIHISLPVDYELRIVPSTAEGLNAVLKLEFTGMSTADPVMSDIARLYNIDTYVINAQMEYTGGIKFGVMLLEVKGALNDIENALGYYRSKNIKAEVLGWVSQ